MVKSRWLATSDLNGWQFFIQYFTSIDIKLITIL